MNSSGSKIISHDSPLTDSIWGKDQTSKFLNGNFEMHKYFITLISSAKYNFAVSSIFDKQVCFCFVLILIFVSFPCIIIGYKVTSDQFMDRDL